MIDTIGDFATRIRNAYLAKHQKVEIPHSRIGETLGKILEKEAYVGHLGVENRKPRKMIVLNLLYTNGQAAIDRIEYVSTPGRKIYVKAKNIPKSLGGYGITIISTSRGIMTDKDARSKKLGGEMLLRVW